VFITTAEFRPLHRHHREQVVEMITAAEAKGQSRMVEMNCQVAEILEKIITALAKDETGCSGGCDDAPDNSARIVLAAKQRSEHTRAKAVQAIRQLERAGAVVTYEAVAASAGVSRSWLYGQADLRVEIERLRERNRTTSPSVPVRQRASDVSLPARLQATLDQCRKLTEENLRLRRQLAHALGDRRVLAPRARALQSPPTLLFDDDPTLADDE